MSNNPTQRLFELMNEIDELLDEMTTTGDAAGFDTPNAFSSMAPGAERKRKNNAAVLGYTLVADDNDSDDAPTN